MGQEACKPGWSVPHALLRVQLPAGWEIREDLDFLYVCGERDKLTVCPSIFCSALQELLDNLPTPHQNM